ncbi:hypothetical protein CBL_00331 [Carabus blaptoides fortunei]
MAQVLFGFLLFTAILWVHVECAEIKEKHFFSFNIPPTTTIFNQYSAAPKTSEKYQADSSTVQSVTEFENHAEVSKFNLIETKTTADAPQASIVTLPSAEVISEDKRPSKISVSLHYSPPVKRTNPFSLKFGSQNSRSSGNTSYTVFSDATTKSATISNDEKPINYLSKRVTDDPKLESGQVGSSEKQFIANVSLSLAPDIYERSSSTPATVDIALCDDCSTSQYHSGASVSIIARPNTLYGSDARKFSTDSVYTRMQIDNTTFLPSSTAAITNEYIKNETTTSATTMITTSITTDTKKMQTIPSVTTTRLFGYVLSGGTNVSNVIEQPINVSQLVEFTESDVSLMFNGQQPVDSPYNSGCNLL